MKELDLIAQHLDRTCAVVIDDFRLFGVEPGWPNKSEVFAKLEATFPVPEWTITLINDQFLAYKAKV